MLEVDQGGGDDYQDEDDAEGDSRRGVVHKHGADAERGREPLHKWIADRNRDSAAATVTAQDQPRHQRDVVVGGPFLLLPREARLIERERTGCHHPIDLWGCSMSGLPVLTI